MRLVETGIAELRAALEAGRTTAVALAAGYLARIAAFDRHGPRLNAVPVLNPAALDEARAADLRRAQGAVRGPLDGIPYTAKASFSVRGLPVTAGSPAFAGLVAGDDAFAIARLRAAGAVLIGLTNMPPMANGGMQRGLYGRPESPYAAGWLTAASTSGQSSTSASRPGTRRPGFQPPLAPATRDCASASASIAASSPARPGCAASAPNALPWNEASASTTASAGTR
jgi:amidase